MGTASAIDIFNDVWTGPDKTKHAAVGLVAGTAGTLVFKNEWAGAGIGCAVGFAKEAYDYDRRDTHKASFQDFAWTCAGAFLAAGGSKYYLNYRNGTPQIVYSIKF
jgi:uncharacterized protein YfiM (DUF2279 family)